jgi:hypothetical protein
MSYRRGRMRSLLPVAAAITSTLAFAGEAAAEDPPAHAIGAITTSGTAEAPLGAALRSAATDGLTAGGARLVPPESVAKILGAVPELATCATPDCHERLASAAAADRLVSIAVDAKGELYALTIAVLDERGRALRRRTDECVACAVPELQERVTAAVQAAVSAATDDTVPVTVDATPAATAITVDGTDRGPSPWSGELIAGPHTATATDAIGASITQEIFVEASPSQQFLLDIPRPRGRRQWGKLTWITAGAGGAAVLGGIVLLSMDGNGTCGVDGTCARQYETTAGGVLTVSAGVALLGAAGWMYWRDHSGERSVTVAPTAGGATATFSTRF